MQRYLYFAPVLGGPGAPRYPVTESPQLVGRSEHADVSLLEPTVSRRHASIQLDGDGVQLVDLGSKHGTYVNSRRVTSARLRVGDIVVFGLSLVLRLEASMEPVPTVSRLQFGDDTPTLLTDDEVRPPKAAKRVTTGGLTTATLERVTDPLGDQRRTGAVDALCNALLPKAHGRLVELRASLREMVDAGRATTDPYPIWAAVESALSALNRVMEVIGDKPEPEHEEVDLHQVLRQAMTEVAPEFAARGITFMAGASSGLRPRTRRSVVHGVIVLLLRSAGRSCRDGSPVEVVTTSDGGLVTLAVSHIGGQLPPSGEDPVLVRAIDDAGSLLTTVGGHLSIESRPGIGATMRACFPIAADRSD